MRRGTKPVDCLVMQYLKRFLAVGYGVVSYVLFLAVFLYAIGFVGGVLVPRSVDNAVATTAGQALGINLSLLALFAAQHSVMARPAFKRWWTRYLPASIERSTYVLLASSLLALLFWLWRSIPFVIWDMTYPPARLAVWTLFWLGWAIVLAATFMINHFELFGVHQVLATWRAQPAPATGFRATMFYRVVRHPLMLGFLIAFWSAPTMTAGHLLFATVTTIYILVALRLEERDLLASLGARYAAYRQAVPMLVPRARRARTGT